MFRDEELSASHNSPVIVTKDVVRHTGQPGSPFDKNLKVLEGKTPFLLGYRRIKEIEI
jgi:hypothetical protein